MHIAFAGRLTLPITGAEKVSLHVLKELLAQDQENIYTFFVSEQAINAIEMHNKNLRIRPYRGVWQSSVGNILWHQLWLPILLKREKIDILFVIQNRVPFLQTCAYVAALYDVSEFRVDKKYDLLRNWYRNTVLKIATRHAKQIVTISESSRNDIEQFLYVPHDKITVMYCGVGSEFFNTPKPDNIRRTLKSRYPVESPYLLYVGALDHPNKNLVRLIQAYNQARQEYNLSHQLLLVGPKRLRAEVIFEEIERSPFCKDIHWLGYVPQADLPLIYAAADVFLYLSLWEGFGLPALEAMASGTPVIASRTSSLPEVVGNAGLLVDPTDVGMIAKAVGLLLNNEQLRLRYCQLGRARAKTFSWQGAAQKLRSVFEYVYNSRN